MRISRRKLKPDRIRLDEAGFTVLSGAEPLCDIAFREIVHVDAYKRDEFATDLLCFDVHVRRQGELLVFWVHEDIPGFDALDARLGDELPGFYRDWREKVVLPPFVENRTVVFSRGTAGAGRS